MSPNVKEMGSTKTAIDQHEKWIFGHYFSGNFLMTEEHSEASDDKFDILRMLNNNCMSPPLYLFSLWTIQRPTYPKSLVQTQTVYSFNGQLFFMLNCFPLAGAGR